MNNRTTSMRGPRVLSVMIAIMFVTSAVAIALTMTGTNERNAFTDNALGDGGDVLNKINFGGAGDDVFNDVIAVPGGFVAVGYSNAGSFKTGDWWNPNGGVAGYGDRDAIIVKFTANNNNNNNMTVAWKMHFGGIGDDEFFGVTMVAASPNDIDNEYFLIAVGYSEYESFGTGSWEDLPDTAGYGDKDAIIVAYNQDGVLITAQNFGGPEDDVFYGVAASSEGNVCAVGYSESGSFNSLVGSWCDDYVWEGYGGKDAIMVVYTDAAFSYARHFGGPGDDVFYGVAAFVDDEGEEFFFAVGYSEFGSFGDGCWGGKDGGTAGYGGDDAIIVGYSNREVIGALNFGGAGQDRFTAVGVGSEGDVFAVGYSGEDSFFVSGEIGKGYWFDNEIEGYGNDDAIIVAFRNGEVLAAMNFGGIGDDSFDGVAVSPEGMVVAAGSSFSDIFGNGDPDDEEVSDVSDAIAVGYGENGILLGAMNFGGSGHDWFNAVAFLPNGNVVAVGASDTDSFGNGDWDGVTGKGGDDAIAVMFDTGDGGDTGGDNGTVGNGDDDFPVMYVAVAAVGVIAVLGIAYVFVLKKP